MRIDFKDNKVNLEVFTTLDECLTLVMKLSILGETVYIQGEIPMNESFLIEIAFILKDHVIDFRGYYKGTQYWMNLCSAEQRVVLELLSDHREERITLPPTITVYFDSEIKGQMSFERIQKLKLYLCGNPLPLPFKRELIPELKELHIWEIHPAVFRHLVPFYDLLNADMSFYLERKLTRNDLLAMAAFYEKLYHFFIPEAVTEMRGAHVFVTRCSSLHRDILRLFLTF